MPCAASSRGCSRRFRRQWTTTFCVTAYLLLCGIGLIAKTQFKPSAWCSTNRDHECSIYTIGMIMLEKIDASPPQAFAAVLELSESVSPNWG